MLSNDTIFLCSPVVIIVINIQYSFHNCTNQQCARRSWTDRQNWQFKNVVCSSVIYFLLKNLTVPIFLGPSNVWALYSTWICCATSSETICSENSLKKAHLQRATIFMENLCLLNIIQGKMDAFWSLISRDDKIIKSIL